jgi:hypothetical protein
LGGTERIQTIIKSSKQRFDGLHKELMILKLDRLQPQILYPCIQIYTKISHHSHFKQTEGIKNCLRDTLKKPLGQSDSKTFNRVQLSALLPFLCWKMCKIDPKHPDWWRRVVLCRTADQGGGKKTLKESLLDMCRICNADWGH